MSTCNLTVMSRRLDGGGNVVSTTLARRRNVLNHCLKLAEHYERVYSLPDFEPFLHEAQVREQVAPRLRSPEEPERVGDIYKQRVTVEQLMSLEGFTYSHRSGGDQHWWRPEKSSGSTSATIHADKPGKVNIWSATCQTVARSGIHRLRRRHVAVIRNYRSTPQILGWANRMATAGRVKSLVATRPHGCLPKVAQLDDDQAEAAWVAKEARRAVRAGTPTTEIAVFYRFHATQARFEAARAQAGIAIIVADDSTFFEREEVRAVLVPFGRGPRVGRVSALSGVG